MPALLLPVPCASSATSACVNAQPCDRLAWTLTSWLTTQAQITWRISHSSVPKGRGDSWHLVAPRDPAHEIWGAASHSPALRGCWCSGAGFCSTWDWPQKCSDHWPQLTVYVDPRGVRSAEAALSAIKQQQWDCMGIFGHTETLSMAPGRSPAVQHSHLQQGWIGKVLVWLKTSFTLGNLFFILYISTGLHWEDRRLRVWGTHN